VGADFNSAMTPDQYMAQNYALWEALHDDLMPRSTITKRLPYQFAELFSILGLGSVLSIESKESPVVDAAGSKEASGVATELTLEEVQDIVGNAVGDSIGLDTPLDGLLDSLASVQLTSDLSSALNDADLPPTLFSDFPTVRLIQTSAFNKRSAESTGGNTWQQQRAADRSNNEAANAMSAAALGLSFQSQAELLEAHPYAHIKQFDLMRYELEEPHRGPLRGTALFYLPGLPGACLREFPRFCQHLSHMTLIGLPYTAFTARSGMNISVAKLADRAAKQMVEIQPSGDLNLMAYSFGTMVAVQVAKKLQNEDRGLSLLVLLDEPRAPTKTSSVGLSGLRTRPSAMRRDCLSYFDRVLPGAKYDLDATADAIIELFQLLPAGEKEDLASLSVLTLVVKAEDSEGAVEIVRQSDGMNNQSARQGFEYAMKKWSHGGSRPSDMCNLVHEIQVPGKHLTFIVDEQLAQESLRSVQSFLCAASMQSVGFTMSCSRLPEDNEGDNTISMEEINEQRERLLKSHVGEICSEWQLPTEEVLPASVEIGFNKLFDDMGAQRSMTPAAFADAVQFIQGYLDDRVQMVLYKRAHPEIEQEEVFQPVFVIGINRTGTTLSFRSLAASGEFDFLSLDDQLAIPEEKDLQNKTAQAGRAQMTNLLSDYYCLEGSHEVEAGEAEEEMGVEMRTGSSLFFDICYDVPNYVNWVNEDKEAARKRYSEHRRFMQFASWRKRQENGGSGGAFDGTTPRKRWVIKLPFHLGFLPQLFEMYPDAVIIQTHRPPTDFLPSWCDLVERCRTNTTHTIDQHKIGQTHMDLMATLLNGSCNFRRENPQLASRWLDVKFENIIKDPTGQTERMLRHIGIEPTDAMLDKVRSYQAIVDGQREAQKAAGKLHKRYTMATYGMTPEKIAETFTEYNDFVGTLPADAFG